MKKTIIFDFDGTIADTLPTVFEILTRLAKQLHYHTASIKEVKYLQSISIPEILKYLKVPFWRLPFIASQTKKELERKIASIKPIKDMDIVLKDLKKQQYTLGIITSNSKDSVERFLHNNSLNVFSFIYSGTSLFGKHHKILSVIHRYNLFPPTTIYVGDEIRDIQAAKKAAIPIISVSWGFNNKKGLQKYRPDFIIDTPKELLKIVNI